MCVKTVINARFKKIVRLTQLKKLGSIKYAVYFVFLVLRSYVVVVVYRVSTVQLRCICEYFLHFYYDLLFLDVSCHLVHSWI